MSLFRRLTDVLNANLHALLDKSEEPEKLLGLVIEEMEEAQIEMRTQAARLIAEGKQMERHQLALERQIAQWEEKAALALEKGREELARAALAEKLAEQEKLRLLGEEQARLGELKVRLESDGERLAAKLAEAREKRKSLTLREETARSRLKVQAQLDTGRMQALMDRFDGMQGKVEQLEAQLEAATWGQNASLAAQFRELEQADEIERELARLRERRGSRA
ncbi:PspA/IM30 family protein [Aeromonas schubertii]|uniref:PspA/IM30 family protein n=1 Tax=Aeromonas schubertii TaxID=652 RepID=A0ABS7VCC3_9GAMM|nr:PspA/IM30 family protein [Aeromonas schubertii]MBZ6067024.1 PspA/IM30 family protein [Aeromonas schubertii]QCG47139.1 phage shock protein PspA [Aeromonas schubertii]